MVFIKTNWAFAMQVQSSVSFPLTGLHRIYEATTCLPSSSGHLRFTLTDLKNQNDILIDPSKQIYDNNVQKLCHFYYIISTSIVKKSYHSKPLISFFSDNNPFSTSPPKWTANDHIICVFFMEQFFSFQKFSQQSIGEYNNLSK